MQKSLADCKKVCNFAAVFQNICKLSNASTKNEHINAITAPEQRKLWRLLLCSYDKFDEYCST